jgi:hypothetical protein
MIPITPFAWKSSTRAAVALNAATRRSSSAGKRPSARAGPASITPITCPGLRRQPRWRQNRRPQRNPQNPQVATIRTTLFAWKSSIRAAVASNAGTRLLSSADKGPSARPRPASIILLTCRLLQSLPRRKPNPRRRPNQPNRLNQRSQRNRRNHHRHRNLRNRGSAEHAKNFISIGWTLVRYVGEGIACGRIGASAREFFLISLLVLPELLREPIAEDAHARRELTVLGIHQRHRR